MTIRLVVEGKGEHGAGPALVRRLAEAGGVYDVTFPPAQSAPLSDLVRAEGLAKRLELSLRLGADAVLVIFDADERCPREHWLGLEACVRGFRAPTGLVVAMREYEAWFLASLGDLRGRCGIREDAEDFPEPENPRDAKGRVSAAMVAGRSYTPTTDQERLTHGIDLAKAHRRCRSFRKLTAEFGDLLEAVGRAPAWPEDWRRHGE